MTRVLLVTNDFPPTVGGIQSYLRDFVATLDPDKLWVFASTQHVEDAIAHDEKVDYEVIRWPRRVMLPTPATARRMQEIIRVNNIDTVWFGASAPLGLMALAARAAGASRIVASTHGHEVGWSMLPPTRLLLRMIGNQSDAVTYISEYTKARLAPAFGNKCSYVALPSGVDSQSFQPAEASEVAQTRKAWGLSTDPVIVCTSRVVRRKGQDQLVRVLAEIPKAQLVIVGSGDYLSRVKRLAEIYGVEDRVVFTGSVSDQDLRGLLAAADIFAMPARTRFSGLDVEGLGIVYLEAQASGLPVIAGDSGGAAETVTPETGIVVSGRDREQLRKAIVRLLEKPQMRSDMGAAGRAYVQDEWNWQLRGHTLAQILGTE